MYFQLYFNFAKVKTLFGIHFFRLKRHESRAESANGLTDISCATVFFPMFEALEPRVWR